MRPGRLPRVFGSADVLTFAVLLAILVLSTLVW